MGVGHAKKFSMTMGTGSSTYPSPLRSIADGTPNPAIAVLAVRSDELYVLPIQYESSMETPLVAVTVAYAATAPSRKK